MGLGVGLGAGLCLELGLKELRPRVEEGKVLGVGMVRAVGLALNTYPFPEALPLTTPSLSRWSCSYLDRVGVTVTVTVTIRIRVRVRVRFNARVRARVLGWSPSYVRCVTGTPSILAKLACLAR